MQVHGIDRGPDMVKILEKNNSKLLHALDSLEKLEDVYETVDLTVAKSQRKPKKFKGGKSWGMV